MKSVFLAPAVAISIAFQMALGALSSLLHLRQVQAASQDSLHLFSLNLQKDPAFFPLFVYVFVDIFPYIWPLAGPNITKKDAAIVEKAELSSRDQDGC